MVNAWCKKAQAMWYDRPSGGEDSLPAVSGSTNVNAQQAALLLDMLCENIERRR